MKIGEFSEKFHITKETVRYYTDIGLLTPVKMGNYYDYNPSCEKEMRLIQELKTMDFSLHEIMQYFTVYRFSNEYSVKLITYRKKVFREKLKSLQNQKQQLENTLDILKHNLSRTQSNNQKQRRFGVPIQLLNLLQCPKCGKLLLMKIGNIEENTVTSGNFVCDCGFCAYLKEGILIFEGAFLEAFDEKKPELTQKPISHEYAACASASTNWMIEKIQSQLSAETVIFDVRTMSGTFGNKLMDACIETIGTDFTYIAMDPDFQNLLDFKEKLIERKEVPTTIMLCGSYENVPLVKPFTDYAASFLGFQALAIYDRFLPFSQITQTLTPHGKWLGLVFWVEKTSHVNEKYKYMSEYLVKDNILSFFRQFKNVHILSTGSTKDPGEIQFYFKEGTEVFFNVFSIDLS